LLLVVGQVYSPETKGQVLITFSDPTEIWAIKNLLPSTFQVRDYNCKNNSIYELGDSEILIQDLKKDHTNDIFKSKIIEYIMSHIEDDKYFRPDWNDKKDVTDFSNLSLEDKDFVLNIEKINQLWYNHYY